MSVLEIGAALALLFTYEQNVTWHLVVVAVYTILRSVHIYKDSREQFEQRTHKRLIDIIEPTQKTVDALISLNLPSGVDIELKL